MQKFKKMKGTKFVPARVFESRPERDSLSALLERTLHGKRTEPMERMVGGRFGHATHRFPIKGGTTLHSLLLDNICKSNALLQLIKSRRHE